MVESDNAHNGVEGGLRRHERGGLAIGEVGRIKYAL